LVGPFVVGLGHAVIAVWLWNRWFEKLGDMLAAKPFNALYILLGMFCLGFVPAVLYTHRELISPAAIVTVFLAMSVLGSWLAGPVGAPSAVPTPFAFYILLWIGILIVATISGILEMRWREHG
ncbi:MAG: hypothetical protein ABEH65_10350, partial [Halobacteriales archaeon]